jgi:hypothetical protein
MTVRGTRSNSTYRILISRSQQRPTAELYGFDLQHPLPSFPIPLSPEDPEPIVPLQDIFLDLYDRARYLTRIDYRQPTPPPALSEIDQQWVEALLAPFQDA